MTRQSTPRCTAAESRVSRDTQHSHGASPPPSRPGTLPFLLGLFPLPSDGSDRGGARRSLVPLREHSFFLLDELSVNSTREQRHLVTSRPRCFCRGRRKLVTPQSESHRIQRQHVRCYVTFVVCTCCHVTSNIQLSPLFSCCRDSRNFVGRPCVVCCSKGGKRGRSRLGTCSSQLAVPRLSHRLPLRLDAISPGDDEHAGFIARFAITLVVLTFAARLVLRQSTVHWIVYDSR